MAVKALSLSGTHVVQAKALAIAPVVQRKKEKDDAEDKRWQSGPASSLAGSFDAGAEVDARLSESKGGGSPLPDPVRAYTEPRFGANSSAVRVHTVIQQKGSPPLQTKKGKRK